MIAPVVDLNVSFAKATKKFELRESTGKIVLQVDYGYDWDSIPSVDGCLIQLWSSALAESHVIQLRIGTPDGDKIVGWLCTVSALFSSQHEYSANEYFRKAAGHAVQILLEDQLVQRSIEEVAPPSLDIFPEQACVFIALKSLLPIEFQTRLSGLLPQLHKYGFIPYQFGSDRSFVAGKHAVANLQLEGLRIKFLKLKMASDQVDFFNFIESLLVNSLGELQEAPYRFFLYYQIVELLMEEVQGNKQSALVIALNGTGGDKTLLHELLQKLNEQSSEKSLIVSLFHDYTKVPAGELDGLRAECVTLLRSMNRDTEVDDCGKALYKVRNMLIHNMRRIPHAGMESLAFVNEYLEVVIPELLITFKKPT